MNPFDYSQPKVTPVNTSNSRKLIDVLQYFVLGLAVLVVIYLFFMIPTQVDGQSMMPNFQNGEILITNHFLQIAGGEGQLLSDYDYQRGDVVVFMRKNQSDLIKRIIGLPGERIMLKNQKIYINGQRLIEDYIDPISKPTLPGTFLTEGTEKVIPAGHYIAFGDNRINSLDSRSIEVGFIKRENLRGSPFLRLFPLTSFGSIPRGSYKLVTE